jgi:hypothetical protein
MNWSQTLDLMIISALATTLSCLHAYDGSDYDTKRKWSLELLTCFPTGNTTVFSSLKIYSISDFKELNGGYSPHGITHFLRSFQRVEF